MHRKYKYYSILIRFHFDKCLMAIFQIYKFIKIINFYTQFGNIRPNVIVFSSLFLSGFNRSISSSYVYIFFALISIEHWDRRRNFFFLSYFNLIFLHSCSCFLRVRLIKWCSFLFSENFRTQTLLLRLFLLWLRLQNRIIQRKVGVFLLLLGFCKFSTSSSEIIRYSDIRESNHRRWKAPTNISISWVFIA